MDTIVNNSRARTPAIKFGLLSKDEQDLVALLSSEKTHDEIKRQLGKTTQWYCAQMSDIVLLLGGECQQTETALRAHIVKAYEVSGRLFEEPPVLHAAYAPRRLTTGTSSVGNSKGASPMTTVSISLLASKSFRIVFAKNIRALARARNIRIATIGLQVGMSNSFLGNLGTGRGALTSAALEAFARLFGVKPEFLMSKEVLTDEHIQLELNPIPHSVSVVPHDEPAAQPNVPEVLLRKPDDAPKSGKQREQCMLNGVDLNSAEFKKVFAKNAKLIAKELNIPLTRVGLNIGLSPSLIHAMSDGGGMTLNAERLRKVAELFGMTARFLMTTTELTVEQVVQQLKRQGSAVAPVEPQIPVQSVRSSTPPDSAPAPPVVQQESAQVSKPGAQPAKAKFLEKFIESRSASHELVLPILDADVLARIVTSHEARDFVQQYDALKKSVQGFNDVSVRNVAMAMLLKELFGTDMKHARMNKS